MERGCSERSAAASLLNAIGLPELIARNLDDYRDLALALAPDRAAPATLKAKLSANRPTTALFDTDRFARNLETAYRAIWQRHRAGLPTAPIDL